MQISGSITSKYLKNFSANSKNQTDKCPVKDNEQTQSYKLSGIPAAQYIAMRGLNIGDKCASNMNTSINAQSDIIPSIVSANSIEIEEAKELLEKCGDKIKSYGHGDKSVEMKIFGTKKVGKWLNGGGTKCAYLVQEKDNDFCVLLPRKNWINALNEANNTKILKNAGLITNDYCKIVPVNINGAIFPALISKPYKSHNFQIFDRKNPDLDNMLEKHMDASLINEENLDELFSGLVSDAKILAENKIAINYDSFNIALKDGKIRLYLNDLPYDEMINKDIVPENHFEHCLNQAISAFENSFSIDVSDSNKLLKKLQTSEGRKEIVNHFADTKKAQSNTDANKTISDQEYEKIMEEVKTGYSKSTEYFAGSKLYNTDGYQKSIEKKYEGLIPYIGEHDFSADINRYLSNREIFALTEAQSEKLVKVLDYSLAKIDEEYGKYKGIVYRKGYFSPKTKQYYSTSTNPKSAARHGGGERYLPYAGYSIIKIKSGHKVYDFQKTHGSHYGDSETEVLLPRNLNYREIPTDELTPDDMKLKEEFASKFFEGAEDVVYKGKRTCGEDRESILKHIKVYEECDNISQ